jgi:AGCS family alanine or glycine:cation symporter
MKRACYAGDIGIGYASVIHSESDETNPAKQAALGVFGIFIDTFVVCTTSVMLILTTGLWSQGLHEERVVAQALGQYVPHIDWVWPIFIFLLGYSTIIAIFNVGKKSAEILSPRYGERTYFVYATLAFIVFSFVGSETQIMTFMSLTGVCLLLINITTIFALRKRVSFKIPSA